MADEVVVDNTVNKEDKPKVDKSIVSKDYISKFATVLVDVATQTDSIYTLVDKIVKDNEELRKRIEALEDING